jgi:hypothetical protein
MTVTRLNFTISASTNNGRFLMRSSSTQSKRQTQKPQARSADKPGRASAPQARDGRAASGPSSLSQACLRLLRCTARSLASSPGGLRFVTGSRPWLEDLPGGTQQRVSTSALSPKKAEVGPQKRTLNGKKQP